MRTKIAWATVVVALVALILGLVTRATTASASATDRCWHNSSSAPIIGSWYAQVHFDGTTYPGGRTEETMITFTPGGGVVEANAINTSPASNSGYWQQNADCTYTVRQLDFTYDPAVTGVTQILDVRLTIVMDDYTHFHTTATTTTYYAYDPKTGVRTAGPLPVPNVSHTVAERFSTWQVPSQFPPEP